MIKLFNYKRKGYAHFDNRVSINQVKSYVENPDKIASHGFYPFIHYTKKAVKYSKQKGRKGKLRELYYSAHLDSYIYQLYAYKLNELYNMRVKRDGINKCAMAYRNNLHKSNIQFAKEVFDFIRKYENAYIIIGDFTTFFDKLDHTYIKKQLCNLLNVDFLPDDYYNVYKNITKYAYFRMEDILAINEVSHKKLNKQKLALTPDQFKENKRTCLRKNKHNYGIPQGAAISSVLSNIYMLDFDKKVNNLVTSQKGLYRRYSDDFVIVLPLKDAKELSAIWQRIEAIRTGIPNLELQPIKTQIFHFEHDNIVSCNELVFTNVSNSKNIMEYLGFAFNGKQVTLRDKTLGKYYYRMYKKVGKVKVKSSKQGEVTGVRDLYKKYSHLGYRFKPQKNKKHGGNFLSYVYRAKKCFGDEDAIDRGIKHHWQKLQKRLA